MGKLHSKGLRRGGQRGRRAFPASFEPRPATLHLYLGCAPHEQRYTITSRKIRNLDCPLTWIICCPWQSPCPALSPSRAAYPALKGLAGVRRRRRFPRAVAGRVGGQGFVANLPRPSLSIDRCKRVREKKRLARCIGTK